MEDNTKTPDPSEAPNPSPEDIDRLQALLDARRQQFLTAEQVKKNAARLSGTALSDDELIKTHQALEDSFATSEPHPSIRHLYTLLSHLIATRK